MDGNDRTGDSQSTVAAAVSPTLDAFRIHKEAVLSEPYFGMVGLPYHADQAPAPSNLLLGDMDRIVATPAVLTSGVDPAEQQGPAGDVARDFFGKACPVQPQGDHLLVLSRNFRSAGCDLQSFAPPDGTNSDLDVLGLYKDLRPSVTYFKMNGVTDGGGKEPAGVEKVWGGSGVVVAKEANDCLVVTDDHVPKGVPEQHVKANATGVVMANGQTYDGTVITSDPAHDLALVKVNTGADTDKVCKVAKVAEKPVATDGSQSVITMGQPYTSHAIYTSTGSVGEMEKRSSINYMIKPLPGEDPDRDILSMNEPIREGFSGAAVFNKDGQAVAINDLETSPFTSVATPITKATVDDLIARRDDKPAGQ